jgi:predicted phage terminase large subunit-like protein
LVLLTEQTRKIIQAAERIRRNKYIPHFPTEKQLAFLALDCKEAMYGGAGGGGKSDALLMGALMYVDVPGYAALILRKTYKDLSLPDAIMSRADQWLRGTDAHWSEEKKTWTFPSGATLTFGYLQHEVDMYQYQGAAGQYIAFDELTQFPERPYRYLFSRMRRLKGFPVPIRMRSATNPGGLGHVWVKQRFLVEGKAHGRIFIPARMEDNPYLDQAAYDESLQELDPVTRAQIREGNWDVVEGGNKFKREWFKIVDVKPADIIKQVRYWDVAATEPKPGKDPDYTVGTLMGRRANGTYIILHQVRLRGTPAAVDAAIYQTARVDGKEVEIWEEQEPGASGVKVIDDRRKLLAGYTYRGDKVTGSKEIRANPVSSQAEAGNIELLQGPWIGAWLDEISVFPNGEHDDQVDSMSGAFGKLTEATGGFAVRYA